MRRQGCFLVSSFVFVAVFRESTSIHSMTGEYPFGMKIANKSMA